MSRCKKIDHPILKKIFYFSLSYKIIKSINMKGSGIMLSLIKILILSIAMLLSEFILFHATLDASEILKAVDKKQKIEKRIISDNSSQIEKAPPKGELKASSIAPSLPQGELKEIIFSENFESGKGNWEFRNGQGVWEVGIPASGPYSAHSGTQCAATNLNGNYISNTWDGLYSPQINLPHVTGTREKIKLTFWHWYELENDYDFGYIYITKDNGQNWNLLEVSYNGTSNGWIQSSIDISEYANQSVVIVFQLSSDGSDNYAGWYIDDVLIQTETTNEWITDQGYDLDIYVGWKGNGRFEHYAPPLDFIIWVDDDPLQFENFTLVLSAWDVDETGVGEGSGLPEVDMVYFNGHYVGKLTGDNDVWSINAFRINPTWVIGGTSQNPGANIIEIYVDVLEVNTYYENWAVQIDYGALSSATSSANGVGFSTNYTDWGQDTNGNGLYEYLVVQATVNIEPGNSGNYAMNGVLTTANGVQIVWDSENAYLYTGENTVYLYFDGETINSFGVDGPYYLTNTVVYNVGNPSINGWVVDAYTTNHYYYTQFESGSMYPVPYVINMYPPDGGEADPTVVITATFNIDMNASTITKNSFKLADSNGLISGTVSYENSTLTASFTPEQPLSQNETYTATLSMNIASSQGVHLSYPVVWGFTTSSQPINIKLKEIQCINQSHVEVMEGGTAHRYYQVVDENDNPIQNARLKYWLSNQGISVEHWSSPSNKQGLIDLRIELGGPNKYDDTDDWATSEDEIITINILEDLLIPGYVPTIIENDIKVFDLGISERTYQQSSNFLLIKQVEAGATAGSIGIGPAGIAAARLSAKTKEGLGLNVTFLNSSDNEEYKVKISRRAELGFGAGFAIGKINMIGKFRFGAEGYTYVVQRGEIEYLFDNPEENVQQIAQTLLILETLNLGGINPSPSLSFIITVLIEVLKELSGMNDVLENQQQRIAAQGGLEAEVGVGIKTGLFNNEFNKIVNIELPNGELDVAVYLGMDMYEHHHSEDPFPFAPQSYYKVYVQRAAGVNVSLLDFEFGKGLPFAIDTHFLPHFGYRGMIEKAGYFDKNWNFLGFGQEIESDATSAYSATHHNIEKTSFYLPKQIIYLFKDEVASNVKHFSFPRNSPDDPENMGYPKFGLDDLIPIAAEIIDQSIITASAYNWNFNYEKMKEDVDVYEVSLDLDLHLAVGVGIIIGIGVDFGYIDSKQYKMADGQFVNAQFGFLKNSSYQDDIYISREFGLIQHIKEKINKVWSEVEKTASELWDWFNTIFTVGKNWILGWWEGIGGMERVTFDASREQESWFKIYGDGDELPNNSTIQIGRYSPHMILDNGIANAYKSSRITLTKEKLITNGLLVGIGRCYQVDAKDQDLNTIIEFQSPANITIMVADKEIHDSGLSLSVKPKIRIYEYSNKTNSWSAVSDMLGNSDSLSTKITKLSTYMLGVEFGIDYEKPGFGDLFPQPDSKIRNLKEITFTVLDSNGTGLNPGRSAVILDTLICDLDFDPETNKVTATNSKMNSLPDGEHIIYISIHDKAGNGNEIEYKFQLSRSATGPISNDNVYFYPNPFNPEIELGKICYSLFNNGNVTIKIYDVTGNLAKVLIENMPQISNIEQGIEWNGKNDNFKTVANGTYFYLIESSSGERAVGKIAVIR